MKRDTDSPMTLRQRLTRSLQAFMVIVGLYLLGFGPVAGTDVYNTGQPETYLHSCYRPLYSIANEAGFRDQLENYSGWWQEVARRVGLLGPGGYGDPYPKWMRPKYDWELTPEEYARRHANDIVVPDVVPDVVAIPGLDEPAPPSAP